MTVECRTRLDGDVLKDFFLLDYELVGVFADFGNIHARLNAMKNTLTALHG